MRERPILLNAEMVRAVLDGRKSQTRRVMKPQPGECNHIHWPDSPKPDFKPFSDGWACGACGNGVSLTERDAKGIACPFGAVGDRLIPAMRIPSLDKRYCADVYGRIWSRAKLDGEWRRLHGSPNSKGYLTVTPALNGKYKTRFVHHLVAEAFYGLRPESSQVRHLDGNQFNNAPDNLDYGDGSENWSDRKALLRGMGERHHAAKLTRKDVCEIRNSSFPQRALASKYGVSQSIISDIKNCRIWQDAPAPDAPNMPRWASRITLEITAVRVERLQDISNEDAKAEGVQQLRGGFWRHYNPEWTQHQLSARGSFATLWKSIYGEESWQANPWVWAISFRRVE